jgi:hypothetical protein
VVSALLLVCAVGCDILVGHDTLQGDVDAPSNLRLSSIIMIAMAGSPIIEGLGLVQQRIALGVVLALVAFFGENTQSESLRTADSAFTITTLLATVYIYNAGGIEAVSVRPDSVDAKPHRRQTLSALCASLMFYSGCRGVRAAFLSTHNARTYKIVYNEGDHSVMSRGTAYGCSTTSIALGFGHGVTAGTGALVGLHRDVHANGSTIISKEVTLAGVIACVSAMWAFFALCDAINNLPLLYGKGACLGSADDCPYATTARRFAISNNSIASLWVNGLAMLTFGSAFESTFDALNVRNNQYLRMYGYHSYSTSLLLSTIAIYGIYTYSDFTIEGWHTDLVTIMSVVASFALFFGRPVFGSILYTAFMSYEQIELLNHGGSRNVMCHLTHLTLFVLLTIIWLHVILVALKSTMKMILPSTNRYVFVDTLLGILSTSGLSLAYALFVASSLLLAASNGTLPQEGNAFRNGSPRRTVVAFSLDHFFPLFIFGPLFTIRTEAAQLLAVARSIFWILPLPFLIISYGIILSTIGTSAPTLDIMQLKPLAPVSVAYVASWLSCALV